MNCAAAWMPAQYKDFHSPSTDFAVVSVVSPRDYTLVVA
jgi:hypothetical protein